MSNDYFAKQLLADLDQKPALEGALEALLVSREVGFDYADDAEAVAHFDSEAEEVSHAFTHESREALIDESGDLVIILAELIRRRDGDIVTVTKDGTRKFLTRLANVEKLMEADGKTWATVGTWKDDVKPNYWDKVKAAGL